MWAVGLLEKGVEGGSITVVVLPESHSYHPPDQPRFSFHNTIVKTKVDIISVNFPVF